MTAIEEPGYLPFSVQSKANYTARGDNEISLIAGQIYVVIATDKKGLWWKSTDAVKGHAAWFPAAYTTVLPKGSTPTATLPPPQQPRPVSAQLVQPAIVKTQSTSLPLPGTQTTTTPTHLSPNNPFGRPSSQHQQPLPQPQQTLPQPQLPQPQQTLPQPQLPQPQLPQPQLPQPQQTLPQPQLPQPQLPQPNQTQPTVPSRPQPNPKPVPVVPNRNSGVRPDHLPTPNNNNNNSKPKLEVDQFVVVQQSDKPPAPSREKIHTETGTYNFLKLQLVECKDLKGVDKNGTPTAFIVHKNPYEQGTQGTVLLQSETAKSNNPIFNEMFKIDVADPEMTQIIIRFSNGKKHVTHGKDKTYIGEIKIELRAAVRTDFNAPNSVFKWFPIKNGSEKSGEAKLFLEFTDLREKTSKGPTNVQHHGHIGIVNGVFSAANLPAEWKDQLKKAGVRKKDLNNPELRDLLFGIILKEGGTLGDDADAQQQQQQPPQQQQPQPPLPNGRPTTQPALPQPNLPQPNLPQPNLPQPNLPQPNLPQPNLPTQPRPNLPPNPQPSLPPINQQPAFLPQNSADDAPMKRGTPPPIKDTAQPGNQPTGRAPRAPRAPVAVLHSATHQEETASAPSQQPAAEKPKPMGPPLNFLDEIARGTKLKAVEERKEPDLPPVQQGGLAGALSAALIANRVALGGGLDEGDEDSDWD